MSVVLEIKGLYGGYEKGVNILQGVNLTVFEGDVVGILGLNGSGKSTLGKAIMNLLPYRRGKIVFDGQFVENLSTSELARRGIALMHQGGSVFPNLSVWQNLQMAWGTKYDKDYYRQLVEIIPLLRVPEKELMHQMADRLSGGQRHELALAMTLARKPKLVVLDEPSAGLSPQAILDMYSKQEECTTPSSALDPKAVNQMNGMLVELKNRFNISIILVEQNISLATSFCNRCVLLGQGSVIQEFDERDLEELGVEYLIESLMFKK